MRVKISEVGLFFVGVFSILFFAASSGSTHAAINETINFQGKLTNTNGTNASAACIATNTCDFQITVRDGGAGSCTASSTLIRQEKFLNQSVNGGIFNLRIGSGNTVSGNAMSAITFDGANYCVQIQFDAQGDDSGYEENFGVMALRATPYAFRAKYADNLSDNAGYVKIGPSSAQADASTNSMVLLNKTGASGNLFQLQQGSQDKFIVDYSGNVGIGAITPSEKLEVSGNIKISSVDPLLILNETDGVPWQYRIASDQWIVQRNGSDRFVVNNTGSVIFKGDYFFNNEDASVRMGASASNSDFILVSNNTNQVTIKSSGNVGIGVSDPGQKLSVGGTLGVLEGGTTPSYYTIFQGGDQAGNVTYTLPTASSNGLLRNTGGVWSWDTNTYLTSYTEVDTLASVTGRGSSTTTGITLSTSGLTLSGVGTDITTASNEDLTLLANGTGNIVVGAGDALGNGTWSMSSAGVLSGATGLTSSGTVTLSGLTANRLVSTTTGGQLTTSITSANAALSVSDETGSGLMVFGTSPTISTSLIAGTASFDLLNTTATTINFGGAAGTMNIGPTGTTAASINIAGGSGATGCTIDGATGNLTCSGTVTATTGFSGNGASLTSLTAGNLSGTIPSAVLGNSTTYVGTTAVALNRASANQGLTGISSVALPGATSGTITLTPAAVAGTTAITLPATSGTLITTGDTSTVTNAMLAGSIANAKLAYSTISGVSLGSNLNALTLGNGLSGTSYNGSGAITAALGNLTGDWSQTGAYDIALANASSELKIMGSGGTYYGIFDVGAITTADKTYTFPDASGTVALTSNLSSYLLLSGGTMTGGITFSGVGTDITTATNEDLTLLANGTGNIVIGTGDALGNGTWSISSAGGASGLTGITSSGTINFSGLSASGIVYTDGSKNLTSTAPTTGTLGYWSRTGTTLSTATAGDLVQFGGNTTFTGTTARTITGPTTGGLTMTVGSGPLTLSTLTSGNISMTSAGTIGITSGTAQGLTIGTGTTGAVSIDSGTTGAISIGTNANAKTINVGTGAVANTITIGSSSATGVSITDNNWNIAANGTANFVSIGATTAGTGAFTTLSSSGNTTVTGDLAVNGGDITTTTTTTFNLVNTTATTINLGGAAITDFNIGATAAGSGRIDFLGGSGSTGCTIDSDGGLACDGTIVAGTTQRTKTITLSPEYPGAVMTKTYGAGTDSSNLGSMTSDTELLAVNGARNFYQWSSTQASPQFYTVAVRFQLPEDFGTWATSNQVQIDYVTSSTTATTSSLRVYIYNSGATPVTASPALGSDLSSTSWATQSYGSIANWSSTSKTAVIYIRMQASNGGTVKIGDIKLNYMSKW